jgi:hypothetical protein
MARNIPGLNNQLYTQMMSARGTNAEEEYMKYKSTVSPLQKKLMYPTMLGAMFADPMYARPILEKLGPKGLAAKVEDSGALGAISGLSVLLPRALSEGYKSRRLAHERSYSKQLGAVGSTSRLLDSISSLRNIMTLPGYTAQMMGYGSGLLRHTPRLEHFLTGQAGNVLKKGASGENTGGLLSSLYSGAKGIGNTLTGGHVSGAITAGAKKDGVAGALSSGAGLLDKGISGLLSSPSGVMFGLMGAQIGLGIYKSIKFAKLQPNRQPPDKFARKFYSPSPSQTAINRILTLAGGGKVDPQTLSFMVLQVQLSELQRLNMQMAGLRGEYHSENDFIRQEKEKGTDRAFDVYGREVLGEDDRSGVSKVLDKLESGLHTFKAKYDPIAQLVNFGVGLLQGKIITPKSETSRIADAYGYSDEKKMIKERTEQFGITSDQTRLLHTTSKSILQMAPTYEGKMLAILSASFDVQRAIASEAITIRTGMGFDKNIMYTEEKGFLGRMISGLTGAISNIPGLNAIGNIITGTGKFIKRAAAIPHKIFEKGKEALAGTRDYFFGESYSKIKDKDEWAKAAGLYISSQDKAFDYVGNGLPNQLERIRSVLFDIYYVQESMLQEMGGEVIKTDERLIWSPTEKRYITLKAAKALEESQKIQLETTRERAFREGPLGKILFIADLLSTKTGKGFFDNLSKKISVERSLERMYGTERATGKAEIALGGEPSTFETSRAMTEILSDISSIKSTMATAVHSMAEIESERQLERTPEDIEWQIKSALTVAGSVLGILLGGPAGFIAAGASAAAFLKARQEREKEIREERERTIETRNIVERGIEIQEEYFNKSFEERFGSELLDKSNQSILQGLKKVTKQEQTLNQLKIIASYLGDKNGSVYELLEPGKRIAEVTVVDKDGKPILLDNVIPPQITQQILILKDIRDYLGGKSDSISNLLDPNKPDTAQVQLLNAAARGGLIDRDKPVLVGEEGPEILMPRSAGMIIPNDQIDKFSEGGFFKGEFFGKIYQKISELVSINMDSLKLDIEQSNKEEKDAQQLTLLEKLQALKERMKEKEEKSWKSNIVNLLTAILKKPTEIKEKLKEKGKSLWDFLKNLIDWKTILAGLLSATAGYLIFTKWDDIKQWFKDYISTPIKNTSDWLEKHGMSIIEQLKLFGRTIVGAGLVLGQWGKGIKGKLPSWMKGPKLSPGMPPISTKIIASQEHMLKEFGTKEITGKKYIMPKSPTYQPNGANLQEYFTQQNTKRTAWEAEQKVLKSSKVLPQEPVNIESSGKFGKSVRAGLRGAGEFVESGFSKVITEIGPKVSAITEPIIVATTKILGPIKSVITFIGEAFKPITNLLKPLAKVVGRLALPLQIVMTAFDFISDTVEGYKEGGLWGAVKGFVMGPMKDDMESTLGQVGKWAGVGMLAGLVGGPIGVLAGGLLGAAFGAVTSALVSAFSAYKEGGLWEGIKQTFLGDKKGGLKSAIKTMGPYALAGFVAGSFFPVVGNIAGALIGASIGGIIGWIGQWGLSDLVTNFGDSFANFITRSNNAIINLFTGPGQKYAETGAVEGSKIAFGIGPLIGGILGSFIDVLVNLGQLMGRVTYNMWIWAKNQGRKIPIIGRFLGEKEEYANADKEFIEDKQRADASRIARDKALDNQIKSQKAEKEEPAKKRKEILAKKEAVKEIKTQTSQISDTPSVPEQVTTQIADEEKKYYDAYNKEWIKSDEKQRKLLEQKYFKEKTERSRKSATPAATPGGIPPPVTATSGRTETPKTSSSSTDTAANIPSPPGSIASVLQEASAATGAPLGIMQRIAYSESGFNPNIKAPAPSTASGLFQFIKETWDSIIKRKGKKYGLSPDTSPFNARANALMGGEFIHENIKDIQGSTLSSPPTAADVYAAHFMGAGGAKQLFREIKKNPNTIAADIFPKQASANENIFYVKSDKSRPRTVKQVYEVLAQKMAVDPGPALAKAGTGLTAGEKAEEFGYKAGEKAKDIFGILGEWATKIKDAFMDALTRQFTRSEATKKPIDNKNSEMKSLEAERDKHVKETSEQAQLDFAASKVSSTPHKIIENYVAERHIIILANKDFQNYYNTHLISSGKKGGKGSKLSADDIKTAAIMIAQKEFLNNPNAESVGMIANLPYKFNPDTAPFKEYLVDSKSSGTKKSEDEISKGLKERAEKEAESSKTVDSKIVGGDVTAVTGGKVPQMNDKELSAWNEAEAGASYKKPTKFGSISPDELAAFKDSSDENKKKYLEQVYISQGKPIPDELRAKAKELGVLKTVGGDVTAVTGGKVPQMNDKELSSKTVQEYNYSILNNITDTTKKIVDENKRRSDAGLGPLSRTQEMMIKNGLSIEDTQSGGRSIGSKWVETDKSGSGTWVSQEDIAAADREKYKNRERETFNKLAKSGELKEMRLAGPGWKYPARKKDISKYNKTFFTGGFTGKVSGSEMKEYLKTKDPFLKYNYDTAENASFGSEAAGKQYGSIKNPAQIIASVKEAGKTIATPPTETDKLNESNKQDAAKKLAQLQATVKPVSQKVVPTGSSQSVPRPSGNLGTSISGPIDDLLENLFNHTLLNDLNKVYPTSYAV